MKVDRYEHIASNGIWFEAERADFSSGVNVFVKPHHSEEDVAKATAEMAAQHAMFVHPELKRFTGYDTVEYRITTTEEGGASMETKTFTIYGASDDLVETSGIPGCDEFGAYSAKNGVNASFVLAGPGGSMRILAMYGPARTPCWAFAPMQVDEGVPFPDWPMRIHTGEPGLGYSTVLEVEVPDGTTLIREEL